MKGKRGREAIRAGSSGLPGRSLQPEMGLAKPIHDLDNQDCPWNRSRHGIDHSHRHGGFVAVIAWIMRLMACMARFIIIMGMPMIMMGMAVTIKRMSIQCGNLVCRDGMEMKLRAQGRRQQQGQRDHSEQKRSNRFHASLSGQNGQMRKPDSPC